MYFSSETVHRIVATAFHKKPSKNHNIVDHIDTNRQNIRFEKIGPNKFSVCDFDFTYPNTYSNSVYGKAVIYTTIKNGNRYMMIFTVKKENYFLLKNDISSMSGTMLIL